MLFCTFAKLGDELMIEEGAYRYVSWPSWPMLLLSVPCRLTLDSLLQKPETSMARFQRKAHHMILVVGGEGDGCNLQRRHPAVGAHDAVPSAAAGVAGVPARRVVPPLLHQTPQRVNCPKNISPRISREPSSFCFSPVVSAERSTHRPLRWSRRTPSALSPPAATAAPPRAAPSSPLRARAREVGEDEELREEAD